MQKAREYSVNREAVRKAYLGRTELLQLIDMDSLAAANIAVAETHHLAWCIGCVCGVGLRTMGWAKDRKHQYLRWKYVKIDRSEAGKVDATITFEYLKGNRDDAAVVLKPLVLCPMSPSPPCSFRYQWHTVC